LESKIYSCCKILFNLLLIVPTSLETECFLVEFLMDWFSRISILLFHYLLRYNIYLRFESVFSNLLDYLLIASTLPLRLHQPTHLHQVLTDRLRVALVSCYYLLASFANVRTEWMFVLLGLYSCLLLFNELTNIIVIVKIQVRLLGLNSSIVNWFCIDRLLLRNLMLQVVGMLDVSSLVFHLSLLDRFIIIIHLYGAYWKYSPYYDYSGSYTLMIILHQQMVGTPSSVSTTPSIYSTTSSATL